MSRTSSFSCSNLSSRKQGGVENDIKDNPFPTNSSQHHYLFQAILTGVIHYHLQHEIHHTGYGRSSRYWRCCCLACTKDVSLYKTRYATACQALILSRVKRSLFDFSQWDNNQPNAAAHKEKLTKGFQDAIELARRVHKKEDAGKWDAIYKNYFQGDDQPNVEDVFRGIVGGTDDQPDGKPDGSSYFERVVVINFKFDDSDTECENNDKVLGWFENLVQGEPNRGVMRICPKALDNYPLQDGTKCEDLDAEVSGKMSTLGGVILHEMT